MRVAYIVLSHQGAEQVRRLVDVLLGESDQCRVIVHHDPTGEPLTLRAHPRLVRVPGNRIRRGDLSIVHATVRALQAVEHQGDYDWVTLLSGQDYPAQPLSAIESTLATTPYEGFLRVRLTHEHARLLRPRYQCRTYTLRSPGGTRTRTLRMPWNVVFGRGFRCYKASQWWTLSRGAVEDLLAFLGTQSAYWKQYARSVIPDESFIQTAVLNGDRAIALENHRFVVWSERGDRHPRVLMPGDVDRAVSSGAWFARKFDARRCPDALDAMDAARWHARGAAA